MVAHSCEPQHLKSLRQMDHGFQGGLACIATSTQSSGVSCLANTGTYLMLVRVHMAGAFYKPL